MSFVKQYLSTAQDVAATPISQRRHFYLHRSLLANKTNPTNDNEPLVGRKGIEAVGIVCQPFWEDDTATIDDEGRLTADYAKKHPEFDVLIRQETLNQLVKAQSALPDNLQIVIKASLRPISVQRELFAEELAKVKAERPALSDDEAYTFTNEYVSDPDRSVPPHATGGTIDIQVIDRSTNQPLDVGSGVNEVGDQSWCDNHDGLTKQQIANRELVITTMLAAGFANLAAEWWHYSYGDQRWAVYYDQPAPRYGAVQL